VELRGFEPMSIADAVRSTPIPILPVFRLSRAAGRVPAPISDDAACLAWRVAGRWPSAFRCRACVGARIRRVGKSITFECAACGEQTGNGR
jgi:hypothetical protein